eukprot:5253622-Prymnesium_polylepis.1
MTADGDVLAVGTSDCVEIYTIYVKEAAQEGAVGSIARRLTAAARSSRAMSLKRPSCMSPSACSKRSSLASHTRSVIGAASQAIPHSLSLRSTLSRRPSSLRNILKLANSQVKRTYVMEPASWFDTSANQGG